MNHKPIEIWEAMDLLGLTKATLGSKKRGGQKKLSTNAVRQCRRKYWLKDATIKELAEEYNVSYYTVHAVVRRQDAYDDVVDMY